MTKTSKARAPFDFALKSYNVPLIVGDATLICIAEYLSKKQK